MQGLLGALTIVTTTNNPQAAEWAFMTYGNCRVTVLDPKGRPYVADVKEAQESRH